MSRNALPARLWVSIGCSVALSVTPCSRKFTCGSSGLMGAHLRAVEADRRGVARARWLGDCVDIGIAHKAHRLRCQQRLAEMVEELGAIGVASEIYERAAKDAQNYWERHAGRQVCTRVVRPRGSMTSCGAD